MTPTKFQTLIDASVLEIGDGYRAKNEELGGDGYLFLRAGHVSDTHISFEGVERFRREVNDKLQIKLSKAGDTVITTKGNSTGRTAFVTEDMPTFVYSPHLSYWRSRDPEQIENGFLRYWSRGDEFQDQLDGMSESTDMAPYLSLTDQRRLKITLPSITDQRAIARVLGALDDKIELNRRLNRSLEELAQAVFRSWFVDFDPVTAKASGRPPVGLDPATAALFPDHFQDSELGEIPKGWEVRRIGSYANNHDSKRKPVKESDRVPGPFPYYGASGIVDYVNDSIFDGEYLLIAEDGENLRTQNTPIAFLATGKFWVNNHAHILSGPTVGVTRFLLFVLRGIDIGGFLTGSTMPKLSQQNMNQIAFVKPPDRLLSAFGVVINGMFDRIHLNERESATLAAARDALLPPLLSGELRVPQAERLVERLV